MNMQIGKTSKSRVAYRRADFVDWAIQRFPELDPTELNHQLPATVFRHELDKLRSPGGMRIIPMSSRSLANLESKGLGPVRIGGEAA